MSSSDIIARRVSSKLQFSPKHKIIERASHEPDLRSEAMKRACWERKPLPSEVLADALQDRCHEDHK